MNEHAIKLFPFFDNGITQVGWVVENLEESVERFYHNTGIGPWHFYDYGPDLLTRMRRNGEDTVFNMSTAVANAGLLRLEMIQPLYGDMVYQQYIDRHGFGGVQHFGIAVKDMASSLEIVRNLGINIAMEGEGYGLDGDGHFAYLDTAEMLGITIELMQRPKRRKPPKKIFPEHTY